jgi:hypothetical protein
MPPGVSLGMLAEHAVAGGGLTVMSDYDSGFRLATLSRLKALILIVPSALLAMTRASIQVRRRFGR